MSKNIFDDEPFRDGQPEFTGGQWKQAETYTPVAENTIRAARALQQEQVVHDEEEIDIEGLTEEVANEDEDEDFSEVLTDARLRLELGRLYEMVMNHSLFDNVEVDVRASKIVQKQIRKFAKEQIELTLGMRQETVQSSGTVVSSPFNDLEVTILKKLASAASKGATESEEANQVEESPVQSPKKKTLNSISSSSNKTKAVAQPKPVAKKTEPIKRQAKPKSDYAPELEMDYKPLDKPFHEMTAQELAERDRQASERQKGRMVVTPKNERAPWPDFATQEMLAMAQVSRATGGNAGISALNGKLSQLVIANTKKN
jgi:hypothetical protein